MFFKELGPLQITLILYFVIVFILLYLKPKMLFKNDNLKFTGCGTSKTIYSFPVVVVFSSIFLYFIVTYIMILRQKM